MPEKRTKQEKKRFLLRLDPEIYEALQRWAADEWRSVNAQIEYLLRDALRRAGRLPGRQAGGRREPASGSPAGGTTGDAPGEAEGAGS